MGLERPVAALRSSHVWRNRLARLGSAALLTLMIVVGLVSLVRLAVSLSAMTPHADFGVYYSVLGCMALICIHSLTDWAFWKIGYVVPFGLLAVLLLWAALVTRLIQTPQPEAPEGR
jgi:hypothetical protein